MRKYISGFGYKKEIFIKPDFHIYGNMAKKKTTKKPKESLPKASEDKEKTEESDENGFSVPIHKSEEDVIREEQKALLNEQHALFKDKFEHPVRWWWKHNFITFIIFALVVIVITVIVIVYKT